MDCNQQLDTEIDSASGLLSNPRIRASILRLEEEVKLMPQVELPVVHRYSGGIYAREITIPAGVVLTGKIYLDDHFDVMVYGDVTVTSDTGRKRLKGFNISSGNQGKKRAGYTHSETRWITFCKSPEMEEDDYIDSLTTESFSELAAHIAKSPYIYNSEIDAAHSDGDGDYNSFKAGYLAAVGKKCMDDQDEYTIMLAELGYSESEVRRQSEFAGDQIDLNVDFGLEVKPSPIEGLGLFASIPFDKGAHIMPARLGGFRTIAGRFSNHSSTPNAEMVVHNNGDISIVTLCNIKAGDELTTNYKDTISKNIAGAKLCLEQ